MNFYFHFPFCKQKCFYCDFFSLSNQEKSINVYCQALIKEIEIYHQKFGDLTAETIYFGGGTPSIIDSEQLATIMAAIKNRFSFNEQTEITIETNPDSLDEEKLEKYLQIGINRLSIGLQAWQNSLLQTIGRTHSLETFLQKYELARKVGFKNINIDLIFALPTQSKAQWQETLENVIKLQPEHIACYSLEWDNNSRFANQLKTGHLKMASESLDRQMYHLACLQLKKAHYQQYEISNFAKIGHECQHNLDFWQNKDYLGFGASAVSRASDKTWQNLANIRAYTQKLTQNQLAIKKIESIDEKNKLINQISLALRTNRGVEKKLLNEVKLQNLIENKLLKKEKNFIFLTTKGKDLLNQILLELELF